MSEFHPGQFVLCIADSLQCPDDMRARFTLPVKGCVYSIRRIIIIPGEGIAFLLNEIRNREIVGRYCGIPVCFEPPFMSSWFRPARETSLEVFYRILGPEAHP